MSTRPWSYRTQHDRLTNNRGQAAIFVAMLFNILFVFFAMAINVALIVHDKINLQNSVDLAAYYAASKQAEILNAIAHENYMIRQSWKLLAWRYRVMGTMGMIDPSTANPAHTGNTADVLWPPAQTPSMCITYQPNWKEVPQGENLCRVPNVKIPPLPQVQVIAGFLPLNQGIAALSQQLIAQFKDECVKHGAYNWWFSMSILQAFRIDQRNRMQVIEALAKNLSNSPTDFLDLDGNSVFTGAQQTFQKNLTYENTQGATITMTNPLGGVDPNTWLPKILIAPTMIYADIDDSNGCEAIPSDVDSLPRLPAAQQLLQQPWPAGFSAGPLFQWAGVMDQVSTSSDYQFTLGVEKNPWYMAYVGMSAKTSPREIFFPIGGGVAMSARAFAKPFGGRIGPWYGNQWSSGATSSSGAPTDPLVPPRVGVGAAADPQDPRRLPNYSRYPGDKLGLTSAMAQNEVSGIGNFTASFANYLNIKADFANGADNDILAWDGSTSGPAIRYMELAAIAPDLFDIFYYSIEPDFFYNYYQRLINSASALGIPSDSVLRPDLGYNGNAIKLYAVQNQMTDIASRNLQLQGAFYFVRDKANLLTGWLPGPGAYNYDPGQAQNFGVCQISDDAMKYKNPGSCVAGGGRVGYSTKLVSYDLLANTAQPLGGPGGSSGQILNPPAATSTGP